MTSAAQPWRPELAAVVGGGTMGAGIAHVLLTAQTRVTVLESGVDACRLASGRITASVTRAAERGHVADPELELSRLRCTTDPADLREAELVVEAVPEDALLKAQVLRAVAAVVGRDAVVATNTSSMSITALAEHVEHPDRFLGLHFFNPVPASVLVEIVCGRRTSAPTVDRGRAVAALLDKECIVVHDSPGFATSRLGVALGLEAIRMVEEGVSSPDDIDRAMTLGYRHPIGPLRLGDLVGHDVRLAIAQYLRRELGERYEPPRLLLEMIAEGRLGKKAGKGFYEWH